MSPSINIYEPLWRIWGILLGDFIVALIFFILWPEYACDSLLPRLQRVIGDTLELAPSGSASSSEDQILNTNSETMRVLTEILQVADDARMEGRTSAVDHNAIVEAAVASQSVTRSDRALLWSMPRQAFSAVAEITAVRSEELLAVTSNCAPLQ